ncbi:recombinase family protein [Azospirillum argentinense]
MAAYGYIRVSTDEQALEGQSLDGQERTIRSLCEKGGAPLSRLFVDAGVSAKIPLRDRPQGGALLAALKSGDKVFATKLDRLFRSDTDFCVTVDELAERGVDVALSDGTPDPTKGGMARILALVMAGFARFEREMIGVRTQAGMDELKAKGRYQGGNPPFGFRREGDALVPIPGFDAIKGRIVELAAAGTSLRRIADTVSAEHGIKVTHPTVSAFLKDRAAEGDAA